MRRKKSLAYQRQKLPVNPEIYNTQTAIPIDTDSVIDLTRRFLHFYKKTPETVEIHFVTKEEIGKIHAQFFDDPTPTDCISLPIDDVVLGTVFVCPQVAQEYVHEHGGDLYREISLYLIHALLHLLGYDDIDEKDLAEMRAQERRALAHLCDHLITA
ncbi:MAG: rRNA maturation RNase YbeY [Simkaniaceae bacterium]|nr:rRNA maturation RNase YbeY [Simkaniaceae bacterium]